MKAFTYKTYILFFLSSLIISCSSSNQPLEELNPEKNIDKITINKKQFETGGMKLGQLTSQPLIKTVSARGYIDVPPSNRAAVSPYYSGYVKKIDVLPGQKIKKGDLLFVLQNPEYLKTQQAYIEVKEQLEYLKTDFNRQQTLANEQIASVKSFNKAEADYRVMLAKYEGLKEQLRLMNIPTSRLDQGVVTSSMNVYAPISGFITTVNTSKSAFINSSDVALEIVNADHIHLELKVFESNAKTIKAHQPIQFSLPETGIESFKGEVHLVGKSIDAKNRTIDIHGHIEEKDAAMFLPGMYVEAAIEVARQEALCLPISAIVETAGEYYILVQTKSKGDLMEFAKQHVTLGKRSGVWAEIENAAILKDKIILTEGAFVMIGG